MPSGNDSLIQKYSSAFSIPTGLAQIVARRFPDQAAAEKFLYPDVSQLHDPKALPDIAEATEQIIKAARNEEGILIYCHDDMDGYTAAAVMAITLRDIVRATQDRVYVYPIAREKDGYILNPEVLREYYRQGVRFLITVDFGISNIDNFRIAREQGLRLVVCDHHETRLLRFSAPAVDPKREDSQYPFHELAGVGVSLKLSQALYQHAFGLTPAEFYNLKKLFFPIAMLGTISDRVLLQGENRVICRHGIDLATRIDDEWLKFFRGDGAVNWFRITSEIIPIFAAASNLNPNPGVEILISEDASFVADTISRLRMADIDRKKTIDSLFNLAVDSAKLYPGIVVCIIRVEKQQYLGSVASRLRAYFKRNTAVLGLKDGRCIGELRSFGLDLYKMLSHHARLFYDFGGHKKAAGFSMAEEDLDRFVQGMVAYIAEHKEEEPDQGTGQEVMPEASIDRADIQQLAILTPFGEGNDPPVLTDGSGLYTIDNALNVIELGRGQ